MGAGTYSRFKRDVKGLTAARPEPNPYMGIGRRFGHWSGCLFAILGSRRLVARRRSAADKTAPAERTLPRSVRGGFVGRSVAVAEKPCGLRARSMGPVPTQPALGPSPAQAVAAA